MIVEYIVNKTILYLEKKLHLETRTVIKTKQIKELFPATRITFKFGDPHYNTTTLESMKKYLQYWKKFLKYSGMKWMVKRDCDNFADVFNGAMKFFNPTQACGVIWDEKNADHGLNVFVFKNGESFEWAYIEPQTGDIYRINNRKVLNWTPTFVRL